MKLPLAAQNAIQRIIEVAQPERVIVFGSYARGQASDRSDLDVLIVKDVPNRKALAGKIYRSLIGVGIPVDVIVVRPQDVERYGDSPALVIYPALREGEVVYAA